MTQYFVTTIDGEEAYSSVKTEKELAELWERNDECGFLDAIIAYRFDVKARKMRKVNVYELACKYFARERAIQEEYEEYSEYVEEYGREPSADDLEMGFNPYMGTYDYDC